MEDITSTLADINPTDRVFKVGKRHVKVRVIRLAPPPGAPAFGVAYLQVSGSQTDRKGRAMTLGASHRIGPVTTHTVQSGAAVPFGELLSDLRRECVEETLRAADLQDQIETFQDA